MPATDPSPLLRFVAVASQLPTRGIYSDITPAAPVTVILRTFDKQTQWSSTLRAPSRLQQRNSTKSVSDSIETALDPPPMFVPQFGKFAAAASLPPTAPGRRLAADFGQTAASTRVQSLVTVVIISAIFILVTLTTTAVVMVLCCKRNTVFALQQREHRMSDPMTDSDLEQCEMQELEHGRRSYDDSELEDDDDNNLYNDDELIPADYYDEESLSSNSKSDDFTDGVNAFRKSGMSLKTTRVRQRCEQSLSAMWSKIKSSHDRPLLRKSASTTSLLNRSPLATDLMITSSRTDLLMTADNVHCLFGSWCEQPDTAFEATPRPQEQQCSVIFTDMQTTNAKERHRLVGSERDRKHRVSNDLTIESSGCRYVYQRLGNGSSEEEVDGDNLTTRLPTSE